MKSLMLFVSVLLRDLGQRCGTDTTRDLKAVTRRVKHEGLSFLTITLTDFAKAFERGLEQGSVTPGMFPSFRNHLSLPVFLRGFMELVFDPVSGTLLDNASIDAIYAIRQFTLAFGKIKIDCSPRRKRKAFASYIKTEKEMQNFSLSWDSNPLRVEFLKASEVLFSDLFRKLNHMVEDATLIPRHGPGITADHLTSNGRYRDMQWTWRLETNGAPVMRYVVPSDSFFAEAEGLHLLEPGQEPPVKVIAVPKTLKTPRIIAVEPGHMQYMQQAVRAAIYDEVAKDSFLAPLLDFRDQTSNQRMASWGSLSGELATLDLSEASDRVSNSLVLDMLKNYPALCALVDSCRSQTADVPGFGVIPLSKFASMGSALCFPFEAMVFLTAVFVGISRERSVPVTHHLISQMLGSVRVFGDDIIIPSTDVHSVMNSLSAFGQKVNSHKSFWIGNFRESCGKEYYNGSDVSIARVRMVFPSSRRHASEMESLTSLRNQHYVLGNWQVVRTLDQLIQRFIPWPAGSNLFSGMAKVTYLPLVDNAFDVSLQRPVRFAARLRSLKPSDILDGWGALQKFFLKGDHIDPDEKHLERAGRPKSVRIKIGWTLD